MNETELKPIYRKLLNDLPGFVREQIELCIYHNDPTYSSLLPLNSTEMGTYFSDEILAEVVKDIAEMILNDANENKENESYVSYDCKC